MSAFAGLFNFSGRPVGDSAALHTLMARSCITSREGKTALPLPHIALYAHVRPFDRLSEIEQQPHVFAEGRVLAWDGRLDNRSDLLVTLHRDLRDDITDAALVAAAYTRWGHDCLVRLIGDWSLAVWDAPHRTLVLARDYMGNRPLYYRELPGGGIAWATRIDALAAAFGLYGQPDHSYIAGRLSSGVPADLTPYRSVRMLLAGHVLVADSKNGIRLRRYWNYSPATITYRDPDSYAEHLRELLTEAVRVRLRSHRRVWSDLSGGWDSSSIVCLAHSMINRGMVDAPAIQPMSWVLSNSPESDESAYIAAVERWCGLQSVRTEFDGAPSFDELLGLRHPATQPRRFTLDSHVDAAGDNVVLSGELGDLVMLSGGPARFGIIEPLLRGSVREWGRLAVARARERRQPLVSLVSHMLWDTYKARKPRVRYSARPSAWRRFTGRRRNVAKTVDILTPMSKDVVPDVPTIPLTLLQDFPILKRPMLEGLYGMCQHHVLVAKDWSSAQTTRTFPYAHRPLVEFVLAIPYLALWDPGLRRSGMRRALSDVLPPEILTRDTKGDPSAALARADRERREQLLDPVVGLSRVDSWALVKGGYLNPAALDQALHALHDEATDRTPVRAKWLRLEAWLQTLATLASTDEPPGSPDDVARVVREATFKPRGRPYNVITAGDLGES